MTLDEALLELVERQDWETKQRMGELLEGVKLEYLNLQRKLEVARDALVKISKTYQNGQSRAICIDVAKQALTATETSTVPQPPEGFMYATSGELFEALGSPPEEAQKQERELNAIVRREQIKQDNKP